MNEHETPMPGFTVWLTGMSGAGKTTIALKLADVLERRGRRVDVLDGDEIRKILSKGLGFSREDRDANVNRIAFVASLLVRHGAAVISGAISPYADARDAARARIGNFVEVYVQCSLDELIRRDTKGLYMRALSGELKRFTGISDPYEAPSSPEVTVDTEHENVDECVAKVVAALEARGFVATPATA
jgi:adenylyl-sulfate kinase